MHRRLAGGIREVAYIGDWQVTLGRWRIQEIGRWHQEGGMHRRLAFLPLLCASHCFVQSLSFQASSTCPIMFGKWGFKIIPGCFILSSFNWLLLCRQSVIDIMHNGYIILSWSLQDVITMYIRNLFSSFWRLRSPGSRCQQMWLRALRLGSYLAPFCSVLAWWKGQARSPLGLCCSGTNLVHEGSARKTPSPPKGLAS